MVGSCAIRTAPDTSALTQGNVFSIQKSVEFVQDEAGTLVGKVR